MYSSLDKVDLSFVFESSAGEPHYFFAQTDHRDGLQIAEDGAFSAVFALVRCLAARARALQTGRQPFRVIYQLTGEAPAVLQYIVAAAGATLVRDLAREGVIAAPLLQPRMSELATTLAEACKQIAAQAWQREQLAPTLDGLDAYLHRCWPCDRDNENTYFRALIEVAAVTTSVLLPKLQAPLFCPAEGLVPFVLSGSCNGKDFSRIDVFGRAQRFVDLGHAESPLALVSAVTGQSLEAQSAFAAYEQLAQERLEPESLEARALQGSLSDPVARAQAEQLAKQAAAALRAWGEPIGDGLRWVSCPARDLDLHKIGKRVHAVAEQAHKGFDGHAGAQPSPALVQALQQACQRHGGISGMRYDWEIAWDFRSAAALGLRVPASSPCFAGLQFADVPDPFSLLLSVWATGFVVDSIDEAGITLVCVTSPASDLV